MTRTCEVCGGPIPEDVKGEVCGRECLRARLGRDRPLAPDPPVPVREAPIEVKALGAAYIYLGAVGCGLGLAALVLIQAGSGLAPEWSRPEAGAALGLLSLLVVGSIAFWAFLAWLGFKLIRLRPWARTVLEVMSWLLTAGVGFAALSLLPLGSRLFGLIPPGGPAASLKFAGLILVLAGTFAVLAPLAALLVCLRSETIREALKAPP